MPLSIAANSDTDQYPYIVSVLADDPSLNKGNDAQLEHDYLMGKRAGLLFIEVNSVSLLVRGNLVQFQARTEEANARVKRVLYC
ncbi:conserved protein of unknown function [Shewanella benthica]|uniref:Uncharacterized protein n=1 Tax=Shewanella benthica TaxID=43661 RepID=A0A330M228_9GAMM|nr:hypothetical protein [Shewanella benthica]SQH76231.1 conserved protein of unknown function [Shewanella benthica]